MGKKLNDCEKAQKKLEYSGKALIRSMIEVSKATKGLSEYFDTIEAIKKEKKRLARIKRIKNLKSFFSNPIKHIKERLNN